MRHNFPLDMTQIHPPPVFLCKFYVLHKSLQDHKMWWMYQSVLSEIVALIVIKLFHFLVVI